MFEHEKYMNRCFDLALKGIGRVSPNPLVGAVIVRSGKILSEGFHKERGGIHAEIDALNKVKGQKLDTAILYCNLEACSHHSKKKINPPCVPQIIQSGIKHVVLAMKDPNPLVTGSGITQLRTAGLIVEEFILYEKAKYINRKYLTNVVKSRPFITLKIAQSIDGRISTKIGDSKWISSRASRKRVHQLRHENDGILTTSNTVIADNPSLTVRHIKGENPIRIVIDRNLRSAISSKIFTDKRSKTLVFNKKKNLKSKWIDYIKIEENDERKFFDALLKELYHRKILSILIESGQKFSTFLIKNKLIDELIFIIAPKLIGSGRNSLGDLNILKISDALNFSKVETDLIDNDIFFRGSFETCLLDL